MKTLVIAAIACFVAVAVSAYVVGGKNAGFIWNTIEKHPFEGGYISDIVWGNDKFIAIGFTGDHRKRIMAYSSDGIRWTEMDYPFANDIPISDIVWGNDKFVAVIGNSGNNDDKSMAYSPDGITWTKMNHPLGKIDDSKIVFENNMFIIYGYAFRRDLEPNESEGYRTTDKMAYSPDGINWTEMNHPFGEFGNISKLVCGNGKFIIEGLIGGYETFYECVISPDGINWTKLNKLKIWNDVKDERKVYTEIFYGNGRFFAVGYLDDKKIAAYSPDGINWTEKNNCSLGAFSGQNIVYGNGRFVSVAKQGVEGAMVEAGEGTEDYEKYINKIAYSLDGLNWTEENNYPFGNVEFGTYEDGIKIFYGNGKFIAVSRQGYDSKQQIAISEVSSATGLTNGRSSEVKAPGEASATGLPGGGVQDRK
ncbi:MAG: hypothetical protein FWF51_03560 [Chitinivibrionia bacterium]|nr:hypothetical protein [Chitinivibrionia bacterium]